MKTRYRAKYKNKIILLSIAYFLMCVVVLILSCLFGGTWCAGGVTRFVTPPEPRAPLFVPLAMLKPVHVSFRRSAVYCVNNVPLC